jgi:hypothetical protein
MTCSVSLSEPQPEFLGFGSIFNALQRRACSLCALPVRFNCVPYLRMIANYLV